MSLPRTREEGAAEGVGFRSRAGAGDDGAHEGLEVEQETPALDVGGVEGDVAVEGGILAGFDLQEAGEDVEAEGEGGPVGTERKIWSTKSSRARLRRLSRVPAISWLLGVESSAGVTMKPLKRKPWR